MTLKACRHCGATGVVKFYRSSTAPVTVDLVSSPPGRSGQVTLTNQSLVAGDELDPVQRDVAEARGQIQEQTGSADPVTIAYPSYLFANLPNPAIGGPRTVSVTDEATAQPGTTYGVLVYTDGVRWRRVSDDQPARTLPTVLMVNGQSNAVAEPPTNAGYSAMVPLLGADLLGFSEATQTFVQLVDGGASSKSNVGGGGTGPGPAAGQLGTRLLRAIATAKGVGTTMRCYALAETGQGIDVFLPASSTKALFNDGTQHATLNNYNLLKSYVTASGVVPQLYVWVQGEANAGETQAVYYGKLKTIFDQSRIDYPGIKWLIFATIGDENMRGGVAGGYLGGPFAAQSQLAAENPNTVMLVDNRDMASQNGAYYDDGTHYSVLDSSYAGFRECALRGMAKLQGLPDRPTVPAAEHVDGALLPVTWDQIWGYRHSIIFSAGRDQVAVWQPHATSNSLSPGGAQGGTHIKAAPKFGNVSVVELNNANSEFYTVNTIAGGNKWTFEAVAWLDKTSVDGNNRALFQVEPAAGGSRIGFYLVVAAFSNQPAIFVEGSGSVVFAGGPVIADDFAHSYAFTYDGPAGAAKMYIDGQLTSTVTGLLDVTTGATARIRVGSLSGTEFFKGQIARASCKAGYVATAEQLAAAHLSAQVEYELLT